MSWLSPELERNAIVATFVLLATTWLLSVVVLERGRERRVRFAELAAALAVTLLVAVTVSPDALPVGWLTPIHEGATTEILHAARADGTHAGPVWNRWLMSWAVVHGEDALGAFDQRRLDGLVRLNLVLVTFSTVVLVAWLRRSMGAVGPLLVAAVAWQPMVRASVTSESPAAVGWVWMVLLGPAALTAASTTGARRVAALTAVVCATLLLAATRVELAAVGLAALALGLSRGAVAPTWERALREAAAVVAVGCLVLNRVVLRSGHALSELVWVTRALDPIDISTVLVPAFLLAVAGPGVLLLVGAGVWRGLRAPLGPGGVAVAWLLLARLYVAAAHGPTVEFRGYVSDYELLRYHGLLVPALIAAAWAGWGAIGPVARRVATLALLVPGLPALLVWTPWTSARHAGAAEWSLFAPLDTDLQREGRFVLDALRAHPRCALIVAVADPMTKTLSWQVAPPATAERSGLRSMPTQSGSLDSVRAGIEGCALLHVGVACAVSGVTCESGGALLRREELLSKPYLHPEHGVEVGETISLELRELP